MDAPIYSLTKPKYIVWLIIIICMFNRTLIYCWLINHPLLILQIFFNSLPCRGRKSFQSGWLFGGWCGTLDQPNLKTEEVLARPSFLENLRRCSSDLQMKRDSTRLFEYEREILIYLNIFIPHGHSYLWAYFFIKIVHIFISLYLMDMHICDCTIFTMIVHIFILDFFHMDDDYGRRLSQLRGRRPLWRTRTGVYEVSVVVGERIVLIIRFLIQEDYNILFSYQVHLPYYGRYTSPIFMTRDR